jgi:hypothetical protein
MSDDDLLEEFETQWEQGDTPELAVFLQQCTPAALPEVACELIQIDLERRWRAEPAETPPDLTHYLTLVPDVFGPATLSDLIRWEYRIRHQWGDCPSRKHFLRSYSALDVDVLAAIDTESVEMDWPIANVVIDGEEVMRASLDRDVTAGRQRSADEPPWSVITQPLVHHFVLTNRLDASLSRNQLTLRLESPGQVKLQNTSSNRALSVHGTGAVDAGMTTRCQIPFAVHLGNRRFLNVQATR